MEAPATPSPATGNKINYTLIAILVLLIIAAVWILIKASSQLDDAEKFQKLQENSAKKRNAELDKWETTLKEKVDECNQLKEQLEEAANREHPLQASANGTTKSKKSSRRSK